MATEFVGARGRDLAGDGEGAVGFFQVCLRGSRRFGGVSAKAADIWPDGRRPSPVKEQHIHGVLIRTERQCVPTFRVPQVRL